MPFDSEFGQFKEMSSLSRVLGPEHIDFDGDITSHEAIQKLLRGEDKTSPTETVLDKESAEIRELLKRVFDKLKDSIFTCNSRPELDAIFMAIHRVQQFPLPQLNRDSGEFDGLMSRHGNLEVGPVDVKLFRFLIVDELAQGSLTPQVLQSWSEFEEVWQKIHLTAPGMGVEGVSKAIAPFEAEQMNEVIELVKERARAINLLDEVRLGRIQKAERTVAELDQVPRVLDFELLEHLLHFRLAGEWPVSPGQSVPLTEELQKTQAIPETLANITVGLTKEKHLPGALISSYLLLTENMYRLFKTKDPIREGFSQLFAKPEKDDENKTEDQLAEEKRKLREANALRDKHLRPNETYTLSDGTLWYWGRIKNEDILLPVDRAVHQEQDGNLTNWFFFRQAIEKRLVGKIEKKLTPRIKQAVVQEAWSTLLRQSGKDSTEGLIQWLESETQQVESWVSAGKIPLDLVEKLKEMPREELWQVESDVIQYRSILQGKRSALNVSPLVMEWQSRIFLMRDTPDKRPEELTLRYLRLMHLLREMLQYDESELQAMLPQETTPNLITSDLMDKIFELTKGDRAPLVKPEWKRE